MPGKEKQDYLFGVNEYELERLRFQHGVWREVTDRFFEKLCIKKGWKCLDAGAGPGFVTEDLRKLVGDKGEVTALEPSELYYEYTKTVGAEKSWSNVKYINSFAEEADLPENYYDLIFARWVITFAKDPEKFITHLLKSLKPGGIIAFQDYNYEGLSLFPQGGAFDNMASKVKAYYRSEGGDPYVASLVPPIFRKHNVEVTYYHPNCLAGGPQSGVYEWAHRFFAVHIQLMADKGILTQAEADAMLADWISHRENPDAIFFSPIVVDIAGVKN